MCVSLLSLSGGTVKIYHGTLDHYREKCLPEKPTVLALEMLGLAWRVSSNSCKLFQELPLSHAHLGKTTAACAQLACHFMSTPCKTELTTQIMGIITRSSCERQQRVFSVCLAPFLPRAHCDCARL
jgi:hypothetical protein